jgi:hypothetical protein
MDQPDLDRFDRLDQLVDDAAAQGVVAVRAVERYRRYASLRGYQNLLEASDFHAAYPSPAVSARKDRHCLQS